MQTIQTITTKSSRLRRGFYWASRYSRSVILLNRSLRLFLPKYSSVNSNYSLDGRVSFRFIGSFQSPDSGFWGSSVSKEGRTRSEKELLIRILLKPFVLYLRVPHGFYSRQWTKRHLNNSILWSSVMPSCSGKKPSSDISTIIWLHRSRV